MSRRNQIIYLVTVAAVFIALEAAALGILKHSGEIQDSWLSRSAHVFSAKVWGGTESIRNFFSLKQENARLVQQNFELAQQVRMYRYITGKDIIADSTDASAGVGNFTYTPATIVKMSSKRQHNYMIIGKGSDDGILPRSGVVTEKGAVGIVDAVSRHYSYVRPFINTEMSVSARIGSEGAVGILRWDGMSSNGAILSEIPHHIAISEGDTIYTSGFSSIFPPDIPLGTLGEKKLVNGSSYEIKVTLFEDFSVMRYVTVVHNTNMHEFEELEAAQ